MNKAFCSVGLLLVMLLGLVVITHPYFFILEKSPLSLPERLDSGEPIAAYVINLDRSPQRYATIQPLIQSLGLPFQRITAVDGSTLSDSELAEVVDNETYLLTQGHSYAKGTIGCSLSHIKAWQTFLESRYDYALIFEDDVTFDPGTLKEILAHLLNKHPLWDICSFDLLHHGFPLSLAKLDSKHALSIYLLKVTHSGAYLINRKAAARLLEYAFTIKMPVDHYFTRGWELGLTFTGIEPRLVTQRDVASTIGASPKGNEKISLSIKITKGIVTLEEGLMRLGHSLKTYLLNS